MNSLSSQTCFCGAFLNFERDRFVDLTAGLKDLLERDSGDAIRAVLRIGTCDFPAQNRRGFCLSIRLVAQGVSAEQAEMRCGPGLARLQTGIAISGSRATPTIRRVKCDAAP